MGTLFASCFDDTNVVVSHGMVYNDFLQNPLIVPVKQLRGHTRYDDYGVMNIAWHPFQPWLFSATVQRIARSGLLPSRGQMQDVPPRLRSQALHVPCLGVSLGSLTGILFSVNLLETISVI